jgi:hypothetical protein
MVTVNVVTEPREIQPVPTRVALRKHRPPPSTFTTADFAHFVLGSNVSLTVQVA